MVRAMLSTFAIANKPISSDMQELEFEKTLMGMLGTWVYKAKYVIGQVTVIIQQW